MFDLPEPCFDVAQLAHVELITPKPEESLWFFKKVLGMQESAREGQSVYLRGFEENCHHSLKLTEGPEARMGHCAWRTSSVPALNRRVEALAATPYGSGWRDGDVGHGPAYEFVTPDGHPMEILWEVERAVIPEEERSRLKPRPQRRPMHGVPVRRIDHINLMAKDMDAVGSVGQFMRDTLGFRLREKLAGPDGHGSRGEWLSVTPLVHEIAVMVDGAGVGNRLHHLCFFYGTHGHLEDVVDILKDRDVLIEIGPGVHGITHAKFLYVREPGGHRIELFGDTGYLILEPDWQPVVWDDADADVAGAWIGETHFEPSWFLYGTPPVELPDMTSDQQGAAHA